MKVCSGSSSSSSSNSSSSSSNNSSSSSSSSSSNDKNDDTNTTCSNSTKISDGNSTWNLRAKDRGFQHGAGGRWQTADASPAS